jgi:hypothetical protein
LRLGLAPRRLTTLVLALGAPTTWLCAGLRWLRAVRLGSLKLHGEQSIHKDQQCAQHDDAPEVPLHPQHREEPGGKEKAIDQVGDELNFGHRFRGKRGIFRRSPETERYCINPYPRGEEREINQTFKRRRNFVFLRACLDEFESSSVNYASDQCRQGSRGRVEFFLASLLEIRR